MGSACSTGHEKFLQTPLGVHFQEKKEVKSSMPNGTHACTCGPKCPEGKFRKAVEFLETESKGVVEYSFDKKQSGWTKGISKFVCVWLHSDNSDVPKSLRKLTPTVEGWVWEEQWHSSKWILYSDPYSHSKHRFRMWRRLQRAPGAWTEGENVETPEEKANEGNKSTDGEGKEEQQLVDDPDKNLSNSVTRRKSHDETRVPTPAEGEKREKKDHPPDIPGAIKND